MRVALIGIGNMGKPMGRNLIKAGHGVTGFDLPEGGRWSTSSNTAARLHRLRSRRQRAPRSS